MFSGIVETVGTVRYIRRRGTIVTLWIEAPDIAESLQLGDSIAVNGTCLTVTERDARGFGVELAPETLRRTTLGQTRAGSPVNLERSLEVGARIGGHFVQGHVDGTGTVRDLHPEGEATLITFSAPPQVMKYVVPKGFIAVDGVSLTIVERIKNGFSVSFIPYTLAHTIARHYRPGTEVNLEADILGKYVERFLEERFSSKEVTEEMLRHFGFIR